MTDYCAQIADLLPQVRQDRQDLNDPTYCDGFPDPEQCRKNLGAQKRTADQEIARLQSAWSSCSTVSTVLTGTWQLAGGGQFTIDNLYNDGSWSGRTLNQVFEVANNTILYGFWNGATLEIRFDAPKPFDPNAGQTLYYHLWGNVNLNTQPLSMQGRWDQDLPPGTRETESIRVWSAQKVS
jgi:hypothetical protein